MHLDNVQLADVLENLHDGLYCTDTHRVITFWNHAAERITGYPAAEVLGRSCAANILVHVDTDGRSLCRGLCPLAMTMADCVGREAEVFLRHRDGPGCRCWCAPGRSRTGRGKWWAGSNCSPT